MYSFPMATLLPSAPPTLILSSDDRPPCFFEKTTPLKRPMQSDVVRGVKSS